MTATYKEIWLKYSNPKIKREIYILRRNVDGTYESTWQQIENVYVPRNPITGISRRMSNESWKFGASTVGSCTFDILNPYDNFSDEEYEGSIFNGYVRDRSKIKVIDYLYDVENEEYSVGETVFLGLIDADRTTRENVVEKVVALDYLGIAKGINVQELIEGDVVINGEFDSDSTWNKGSSNLWEISGNKAQADSATTSDNLTQSLVLRSGEEYTIYYTISNISTGTVAVSLGSTTDTARDKAGTYSFTHTPASESETLSFIPSSTDCSIDSVRVVRLLDLNDAIYELMNNTEFTDYFTVDASSTYIDPPVNYTVDLSKYSGSVYSCLENLATGMSLFYIDRTTNYFYFIEPTPTVAVQHEFLVENERKLKIYNMREGTDRVYNAVYWGGETENAIDATAIRIKEITIDILGVTSSADRQDIIDFIINRQKTKRRYFKLDIPYAPFVEQLDKINVQSFGQAPASVARYGFAIWGLDTWGKAVGIKISSSLDWMIRSVDHNGNLQTTIEVEIIIT